MIPLDDAIAHVLAGCAPLPPARMADDGGGRDACWLADVVAREPVPPFANTAMDGYARAGGRRGRRAGDPAGGGGGGRGSSGRPRPLRPGEAMRIFTGAPMPDGADAVVMVERTERLRRRQGRRDPGVGRSRQPRAGSGRGPPCRRARCFGAGDELDAGPSRRARIPGRRRGRGPPAAPGGRDVDGRRAGGRPRRRCSRDRSATATARRCWRWSPRRGSTPVDLGRVRRRRGRHRGGASSGVPPRATRCSPAAGCRWATSTWSGSFSTASATCAGCRWRSVRPSRWRSASSVPGTADDATCRSSACPATPCHRW